MKILLLGFAGGLVMYGCIVLGSLLAGTSPYQCDCAAVNTECGQPGVYNSVREWEKTLEKGPTDAERTALSNVIDGEGV